MPVLSLMAKIGADVSGFQAAMGKIKSVTAPAGMQIGQQLRGKILEGFGVAGGIAMVKQSMDRAVDVNRGAKQLNVSNGTYQALEKVAERSGISMEQLVETMNSGTAAGDALKDSVERVRAEMEDTGALLSDTTIANLVEFRDKLDKLFGRLAPMLSTLISWLNGLYDWVEKMVRLAGAGGLMLFAKAKGDKELFEAGREMAREAANPQAQTSSVEEAAAAARAAAVVQRGGSGTSSSGNFRPLDVSSATSVGGYRNPQFSMYQGGVETEIRRLSERVGEIQTLIRRGVE